MILAVDPGLTGAFAWTDGFALAVRDMPTRTAIVSGKERRVICEAGVARLLRSCRSRADILVIEQVNGMPGQSGPAAFTFGYGAGVIAGVGEALGYRIEKVVPARWKAAMAVPHDPTPKNKKNARARAAALWPRWSGLWATRAENGPHPISAADGRAEASILALYGMKVFGGLHVHSDDH